MRPNEPRAWARGRRNGACEAPRGEAGKYLGTGAAPVPSYSRLSVVGVGAGGGGILTSLGAQMSGQAGGQ